MAEALVKLFQKRLNSLQIQNPDLFTPINAQILHLQTILESIGAFAEEADRSKHGSKRARKWLRELRETIYAVEDCIDQFLIQMNPQDCANELVKLNTHLAEILNSKPGFKIRSSLMATLGAGDQSLASFVSNYMKLPYYLRSCLMYCCALPMTYDQISVGRLVRFWVAEGLVVEEAGKVLEDVGEGYVEKLIELGMLKKKVERTSSVTFKVPKLYRKFLLNELLEEGFLTSSSESVDPKIHPPVRFVSFLDLGEGIPNLKTNPTIRSLLILCDRKERWDCPKNVFHGFKLLRVLKLEGLKMEKLPDEVGNLIHLRFLGLKNSEIFELPESIGNLCNLLTLDIRWCGRICSILPEGILNLVNLRHLLMFKNSHVCGMKLPVGIGGLAKLQSIEGIYAGGSISRELGGLTQLRELEVMDFSEDHSSELYESIMNMKGLLSLTLGTVISGEEDIMPDLEPFVPPPLLRKLRLNGRLVSLPGWLSSAENLIKLDLSLSYLSENPTLLLQFLPNLKHLSLWEAYNAKRIGKDFCQVGGFPKLEVLIIASDNLVEWTNIEDGALPSLKFLSFRNCLKLMSLPEGLQYLTTLQKLKLIPLHGDHARRLLHAKAPENYKIKHIPKVRCYVY